MFVLRPLVLTVQYSLYRWNGIGAVDAGSACDNYVTVLHRPRPARRSIVNAFKLIVFFSVIPVAARAARRVDRSAGSPTGASAPSSRTVLFLPQVIPLVAAGIVVELAAVLDRSGQPGAVARSASGGVTRAWLGDFDTALPAVGVIGAWVLLGLCTMLLLAGMSKIDPALYEAARLDGAGPFREFLAITLPSLRQEIGVCVTVTVIAALASFDIVYISTSGGPGNADHGARAGDLLPGLLRAAGRAGVGARRRAHASSCWPVVLPIQRLTEETESMIVAPPRGLDRAGAAGRADGRHACCRS